MRSECLETVECDGWRLRVDFHWHVDRYRHVIAAVDSAGIVTSLLESIEGSPADDWPASPPLQSLHCETMAGGSRVALLVGMAGRGHWSASIGPRTNENCLAFDLACRADYFAGRLGSAYRLASGIHIESAASDLIKLQVANRTVELRASQVQATRCETVVFENRELQIHPTGRPAATTTQRWLYEIATVV